MGESVMFLMYCLFTVMLFSFSTFIYYTGIFIEGMIKPSVNKGKYKNNQKSTTVYYRSSLLYLILIEYGLLILLSYLVFPQFPNLLFIEFLVMTFLVLLYFINRIIGKTLSPEKVRDQFTSSFSGESTYGPELDGGGDCGGDGGGAGAD
ncbi:hypothetical protein [Rossellomorea sp. KS-H15a]|uniref:hypothetical protein n=1 Tax=Rossellomorea sp. KS-H15a TaxID=2963940 RepID=UPI0020C6C409|nr:hypothetical protein [Rossellomorea sp. KS-H15a]UTE77994.1 hypothetical protein M1J35_04290 [Rossellomorea sp. KS-H15a]